MTGVEKRVSRPLIVACVIAMLAMLALNRPLARGDGLAYLMWLDSVAVDGDLDLGNQAQSFAHVNSYQVYLNEETGRWATAFPYGVTFLLTPAYWLARTVDALGWFSVNPEYFVALQGRPFPYSFFPMLAVNLLGLVTLLLSYRCARFFAAPLPAAASALFLFLGTPVLYYATVEPFYVHMPATFMVALTCYLLLRGADQPENLWLPLLAGLAGGLATLVRWQVSLTVWMLAVGLLLLRRGWRATAAFALGFWALAWHVLYTWGWMFGEPLVVSAAESGFLSWPTNALEVLFSDGRGLFVWSPMTFLAVIGWAFLARHRKELALGLLGAFSLQTFLNASVIDWWGGWSFGMRRMTELYPLFVLGLAALLDKLKNRHLRGILWGVASVALCFSLLLLLSHLNFINTVQNKPQGDRASVEIAYQLTESNARVLWQVFRDHYGPWAWSRPGP